MRFARSGFARAAATALSVSFVAVPVALAQESAGAEEAGHAPSIMNVEPGLMIWTVVTFVVLLVALRFMAWKPLMSSLEARERRIREAVEGAERARAESEAVLAKHRAALDAAREEAHKIIEAGKSDGLKLQHEIQAEARREAEEFKARSRRELDLAVEQAKKDLFEQASKLSTELAEKILLRSLEGVEHRRLIEQVLDEYRSVGSSGSD